MSQPQLAGDPDVGGLSAEDVAVFDDGFSVLALRKVLVAAVEMTGLLSLRRPRAPGHRDQDGQDTHDPAAGCSRHSDLHTPVRRLGEPLLLHSALPSAVGPFARTCTRANSDTRVPLPIATDSSLVPPPGQSGTARAPPHADPTALALARRSMPRRSLRRSSPAASAGRGFFPPRWSGPH